MFDIIHKHYHQGDSKSETRIIHTIENIQTIPHDPICQRCEKRFSSCKCKQGFISTGSLMLPNTSSKEEAKK